MGNEESLLPGENTHNLLKENDYEKIEKTGSRAVGIDPVAVFGGPRICI